MTGSTADDNEIVITTEGIFRIRIEPDYEVGSPREWSNLGTMVLGHRRYDLPREGDLVGQVDQALQRHSLAVVARWLRVFHGATTVLPVWGYDHGSLHLQADVRTGSFADPWDSGFAGIIYDTPASRKECGTPRRPATDDELAEWRAGEVIEGAYVAPDNGTLYVPDMAAALAAEVELYDRWANGEFVGFVVEKRVRLYHENGDVWGDVWSEVDSCWGIDDPEYARKSARAAIPGDVIDGESNDRR